MIYKKIRLIIIFYFALQINIKLHATSSGGNSGLIFIGFSDTGETIAFQNYYEEYKLFEDTELGSYMDYFRIYDGIYLYNFKNNTVIKASDDTNCFYKGYGFFGDAEDKKKLNKKNVKIKLREIRNLFCIKDTNLFFRGKKISNDNFYYKDIENVFRHKTKKIYAVTICVEHRSEYHYNLFIVDNGKVYKYATINMSER